MTAFPSKHTDLDDHIGLSTFKQAGMYCMSAPWYGASTVSAVASRAFFARFVPPRNMTIVSMAFAISTAASIDDPMDIGIYDAALAKIVTAGATLGKLNSIGAKTVPIAAFLLANTVYYAAFSFGTVGGTAAIIDGITNGGSNTAYLFGGNPPQAENGFQNVHPLPATIVPGGAITTVPLLAVRES